MLQLLLPLLLLLPPPVLLRCDLGTGLDERQLLLEKPC
jgi:hypothetical protein